MLGGIFALLAAATFAINNVLARRGVVSGSVFQALAITIPLSVPLFLLAVLVTGSWSSIFGFSSNAYLALAVAGIVHFVWGRYCLYRATKAMGANLVGPLQQVALLVALVLAIVLLGEKLTPLKIVGLFLVIVGPVLAFGSSEDGGGKPASVKRTSGFVPNYTEGYTWALLSATGTGISPILVRHVLENSNIGSGLAGGLISAAAATAVFAVVVLYTGQGAHIASMDRRNTAWFVVAGLFVFLSQMLRYLALVFAPVTVVTPIQRLTVLFRMYFGWVVNRDYEVFESKVIVATVLSMVGAILLSISTDVVINNVPMPAWLVDLARFQWP